ncbi:phage portal protein, HK97 family [Pilibacter termitis]|uniref:Phage portal protein, HK97 family n=1 Tax=Pilibacter termitis TaxID=263852 RepID=A0A1T4PDH6_9ENTE|nr:phage portal protein [Pilibacter termitis]SJZ89635.1 phage portal protein, HK97 family [Pilibacter termitis]
MSWLDFLMKRKDSTYFFDLNLGVNVSERVQMKEMALSVCASYIARVISRSEFRVLNNGKNERSKWYYKLNVKPNTSQTATTFWHFAMETLIRENELLIIKSDTDDLLIAESYVRKEYALFEDVFSQVVVKNYQFERTFKRSEVIFIELGNHKLNDFIEGLWADYGDLLSFLIATQKRNGQVRATIETDLNSKLDDNVQNKNKTLIENIKNAIANSPVAIIPTNNRMKYSESSTSSKVSNQSIEEIIKLRSSYLDDVAIMLGIPPTLLRAEKADESENWVLFIENCIEPLVSRLNDELSAQLFDEKEYLEGKEIKIIHSQKKSLFDLASSIDKLISSGAFTRNEVRKELNYESVEEGDEFFITKNYERTVKGGEDE